LTQNKNIIKLISNTHLFCYSA